MSTDPQFEYKGKSFFFYFNDVHEHLETVNDQKDKLEFLYFALKEFEQNDGYYTNDEDGERIPRDLKSEINKIESEIKHIHNIQNDKILQSVNPNQRTQSSNPEISDRLKKLNWYGTEETIIYLFMSLKNMGLIDEISLSHIQSYIPKYFYDGKNNKEYSNTQLNKAKQRLLEKSESIIQKNPDNKKISVLIDELKLVTD